MRCAPREPRGEAQESAVSLAAGQDRKIRGLPARSGRAWHKILSAC